METQASAAPNGGLEFLNRWLDVVTSPIIAEIGPVVLMENQPIDKSRKEPLLLLAQHWNEAARRSRQRTVVVNIEDSGPRRSWTFQSDLLAAGGIGAILDISRKREVCFIPRLQLHKDASICVRVSALYS